jgi:glyoxylase-like metal-dependent hydrolase (beta-lactamase superfamily II)
MRPAEPCGRKGHATTVRSGRMDRITLGNTVFEGQNNVYAFGVGGDGPVTLIDCGIATDEVRADLASGLDELGVGVAGVDQVLLTHWHEDHAGLAGWLQSESGATVRAHAADAPLIEGDTEAYDRMEARQSDRFEQWGMPADSREELLAFRAEFDDARGDPADVLAFEDGDSLRAGEHDLEAVHLPGHAAGLSGFVADRIDRPERVGPESGESGDDTELFAGDSLLPHYTPNVGGADVRVDRPLEQYLETLTRIVERGFAIAWPGHRDPISDPTGRAKAIATHHRERTERIVSFLREDGPADAWTVSAHLFGDLDTIHILHGPGEAYAHLDHLTGTVVEQVIEDDGRVLYRLIEDDPDLDRLFPDFASAE